MRYLIFILLVIGTACSTAQTKYSTNNKKAISLFEQGQEEPRINLDPKTKQPNYRGGILFLQKALEKDPKFWEAHLLSAEFYEYLGEYPKAIEHYKNALAINPNHSPSGSTYFYLANLQNAIGEYNLSSKNIEIYIQNRNANPSLVQKALNLQANNTFSIEAIKNPQLFNPVNVGPGINTKDPEYFPTITVDGKTILFTRRIKDQRTPVGEQEDFYVSNLSSNFIWETAFPMPSNVNTTLNEGAPTISADGKSLIFVACSGMSGDNNYGENRTGKGSCDLFVTKKLGSRWTDPENIDLPINTASWESQPSLSADGKTLYFIRRVSKKGEEPNSDIFVSKRNENGKWGLPTRLPSHINSPMQEESVLIHPDGKTLYFASRGHTGMGGSDLFISRMDKNGNWSKPENLGYPINTKYDENSLMVSPEGDIAFFASDREGGYGNLDIYYFILPEKFRATKTLYFEGVVFDVMTKKPVPGKFQLIDIQTGEEIIVAEADKVNGSFVVSLPINKEYALNVSYPGYAYFSKNFNMTNPDNLEAIHMDVPLVPLDNLSAGPAIVLENVFFDLGLSTLRKESYIELNKLSEFLIKNPTIKIEIGGHTDSRGNDQDNLKLSNDRAKAVYNYLITKTIDAKRLSYKGYGETQPKISDTEISKLPTEKEKEVAHQANRRTEYKIVK